jgi:hypothetical protein
MYYNKNGSYSFSELRVYLIRQVLCMKKNRLIMFTLFLTVIFTANCWANNGPGPLELSKKNILPSDSISISLDGRHIYPELIKQDGIIYARASELLSTFGYTSDWNNDFIKIGDLSFPAWRAGYTVENGKKELYLPLLDILGALNIGYLYSDLYGKDVVSIRTGEYSDNTNYYTTPSVANSTSVPSISSNDSRDNNNINININNTPVNQQTMSYTNGTTGGNSLPDIPGYNGQPISSVSDLLAMSNYNNIVRGYGRRSMLGFYSVYGVEPQPFGTGFPYALSGPTYYYNSPYWGPGPCNGNSPYWGNPGYPCNGNRPYYTMPQPSTNCMPTYWGF